MSKQWQIRRGTTAENNEFTGAVGELTMDTDKNQIRLHDGAKQGGYTIDPIVAFQVPSEDNGYTWYRKYASGWVEMGGEIHIANDTYVTITLPVEMLNTSYQVQKTGIGESTGTTASYRSYCITNRTTTSFQTFAQQMSTEGFMWYLCGMAA